MQATTQESPFEEFETAWASFLVAVAGVYSKLEQGAKGNNKGEPWFGKVKHVRKKDPLLSYLHHARDSEEHLLQRSDEGTFL